MLTGEAKKDFVYQCVLIYEGFVSLPETCQNALIIDWFDSVGIYIEPRKYGKGWGFDLFGKTKLINEEFFAKDRTGATIKAIEKANDLYNHIKKQQRSNNP